MSNEIMLCLAVALIALPLGYYLGKAVWQKLSYPGVIIVALLVIAQSLTIYLTYSGLFFVQVSALMLGVAISLIAQLVSEANALAERVAAEDYKLRCVIGEYLNGTGVGSEKPALAIDISDYHPSAVSTVLDWLSAIECDCSEIITYHNSAVKIDGQTKTPGRLLLVSKDKH